MRILITRPAGKGESLVRLLEPLVEAVCYQPLMAITPGPDLAALAAGLKQQKPDMLIFVSGFAVDYFTATMKTADPGCSKADMLAVGQATAAKLQQWSGQTVITPAVENSEGLLALAQLQGEQIRGKNIAIIRGVGGRELLAEQLQSRGAKTRYWQLYRRQPISGQGEAWFARWQSAQIDCIVITSVAILNTLLESLPTAASHWLQRCRWIVASARIGTQARRAGIAAKQISNADGAGDEAIVAQVRRLLMVEKNQENQENRK